MKEFPVLNCAESIGIDYDGYVSVKCKKPFWNLYLQDKPERRV